MNVRNINPFAIEVNVGKVKWLYIAVYKLISYPDEMGCMLINALWKYEHILFDGDLNTNLLGSMTESRNINE